MFADKVGMPSTGTIYDFHWDMKKKEWVPWTDTV